MMLDYPLCERVWRFVPEPTDYPRVVWIVSSSNPDLEVIDHKQDVEFIAENGERVVSAVTPIEALMLLEGEGHIILAYSDERWLATIYGVQGSAAAPTPMGLLQQVLDVLDNQHAHR